MERHPCKKYRYSKKYLQEICIPQEIWRDILRRLPIISIMRCWSVCKSWRNLIESDGLLAKQCMAFVRQDEMGYGVADEDGQPLFQFDLPSCPTPPHHRLVISSVNGLLLLWDGLYDSNDFLFVVNPMTCEYIELPPQPTRRCVYGFGVSKLSGQYKILCIDESGFCHVYTLGGECSWRRIPAPPTTRLPTIPSMGFTPRPSLDSVVFYNGNIHWVACDFEKNFLVCCFDLETELFTNFPLPPLNERILIQPEYTRLALLYLGYRLCILEDKLWFCDTSYPIDNPKIWKMDNYGDASSWIMEYNFKSPAKPTTPIKVLMNGDLLFGDQGPLFIYSKSTEGCVKDANLHQYSYYYFPCITTYTPSFSSLKKMGIHNVKSLCFH